MTMKRIVQTKKFHVYMLITYFKQKYFGGIRIKSNRELSGKYNGSCRKFTVAALGAVCSDSLFYGYISVSPPRINMNVYQRKWQVGPVI